MYRATPGGQPSINVKQRHLCYLKEWTVKAPSVCPNNKWRVIFFSRFTVLWSIWYLKTYDDMMQRCLSGVYYFNQFTHILIVLFCRSQRVEIYTLQSNTSENPLFNTVEVLWPPNCRGMTMPWKNRWYSIPCRPPWSYSFLGNGVWHRCHQGRTKKKTEMFTRKKKKHLADVLQRWSCCFFLFSAILNVGTKGAGQSTLIKNLHEKFRQIQAFAGGDCISPTQNQVSLEDFPT